VFWPIPHLLGRASAASAPSSARPRSFVSAARFPYSGVRGDREARQRWLESGSGSEAIMSTGTLLDATTSRRHAAPISVLVVSLCFAAEGGDSVYYRHLVTRTGNQASVRKCSPRCWRPLPSSSPSHLLCRYYSMCCEFLPEQCASGCAVILVRWMIPSRAAPGMRCSNWGYCARAFVRSRS